MSKPSKKQKQNSCADENNIKCGEIMFSNNTKFCFSCTFCQKSCKQVKEFFRHVLYDHLNYLEEYQFDENEDFLSKIQDQCEIEEEQTEFVNVNIGEDSKQGKKNTGFSNHFEEFVCQNIPSSMSIKSEEDDEEEDVDYKDDIEEFEFFLDNAQPSPVPQQPAPMIQRSKSTDSKTKFEDILHIEFLEEPSENEYEPENIDTNENHSSKNQSDDEDNDDNNEDGASNSSTELYKNETEEEEEEEKRPRLIITHEGDETKENNFKCPYKDCKKVFVTKNGAQRHIQNIHHKSSTKRVACETCFKTFNNKGQLGKHMLRHLGVKPHPCEICGQCFSDKSNLNVHVMRHKGIKPHECSVCQKRFHSSTELKLHTRSHTGERPFVCELCGRKFSNSGHLCNHRRRHFGDKRFECDVCQKRFFDRKLLNDHKVMHSDERPFECETCAATFQRKKALLQHEKLHSGIKQYVCKICGKSFAQNAGLYSHMKGH